MQYPARKPPIVDKLASRHFLSAIITVMSENAPTKVLVKDIMSRNPITASPEMSLLDVAKVISEHNFNGLPVVDSENRVIGIITEYDLINKASEATIETLRNVLRDISSSKNRNYMLDKKPQEIYPLKVSDVMTSKPVTVSPEMPFEDLVDLFRKNQKINPIPVVDRDNKLIGVVSRYDILRPLGIYRFPGAIDNTAKN
ncbi:MAG: CBS domain protein [Candidatus Yanofskybacteria bacterium GW2011_GWA2_44_9]|uniref:CBS domain protein n=2 Tax=Candidatus Yanofskyibacteriota TaxID=1752733 RepID=A0A0G1KFP7_9BACT|nr:MAG: CBS domain protein [Candidatus Yanofskybacteria bacterium GW2011_GWA2_44_9]